MRLNGWQRLWVVVSVLYLLPVVGIGIRAWPIPETTSHRDEFIAQLPREFQALVLGAYDSEREREDTPTGKLLKEAEGRGLSKRLRFPNGAILVVQVEKDGAFDKRVAEAYWVLVKDATRAARVKIGWQLALLGLVPCLALYALGWAIAWVRCGFLGGRTL